MKMFVNVRYIVFFFAKNSLKMRFSAQSVKWAILRKSGKGDTHQ